MFFLEVLFGFVLSSSTVDPGVGWLFFAPFFAPWLGPTEHEWHVYAAAAFLCIPFMLVSMRVERWSAEKRVHRDQARRWARLANISTYAPLVAGLVALTIVSYIRSP